MASFTFDVRYEWNGTVVVYADSLEEAQSLAIVAGQEQFGEEMEGTLPPQDDIEVYPVES